jgi:hypothetical protein
MQKFEFFHKVTHNGLHWRSTWEFIVRLLGADDELKSKVETTH